MRDSYYTAVPDDILTLSSRLQDSQWLDMWLLSGPSSSIRPQDLSCFDIDRTTPSCHSQVFGNEEAVAWLYDRLKCHCENLQQKGRRKQASKRRRRDHGDDSDDDAGEAAASLIELCGETGTGKTSAVLAMANELNLRVIEINAGHARSASAIRRLVSEATQSRGVSENAVLLFDEADILLDYDSGLHAAICELARSSKCPIVVTSEKPISWPRSVASQRLTFRRLDVHKTQLAVTHAVERAGSNLDGSSAAISLLSEVCGGDVRRAVNSIALTRSAPAPCKFADWLQKKKYDFIVMDSLDRTLQPILALESNLGTVVSPPAIKVDAIFPVAIPHNLPSVLAIRGSGLTEGVLEVFVGVTACEVKLVSCKLAFALVPASITSGLQRVLFVAGGRTVGTDMLFISGTFERKSKRDLRESEGTASTGQTTQEISDDSDDFEVEDIGGGGGGRFSRIISDSDSELDHELKSADEKEEDIEVVLNNVVTHEEHISHEALLSLLQDSIEYSEFTSELRKDCAFTNEEVLLHQTWDLCTSAMKSPSFEGTATAFSLGHRLASTLTSKLPCAITLWSAIPTKNVARSSFFVKTVSADDLSMKSTVASMLSHWSAADVIRGLGDGSCGAELLSISNASLKRHVTQWGLVGIKADSKPTEAVEVLSPKVISDKTVSLPAKEVKRSRLDEFESEEEDGTEAPTGMDGQDVEFATKGAEKNLQLRLESLSVRGYPAMGLRRANVFRIYGSWIRDDPYLYGRRYGQRMCIWDFATAWSPYMSKIITADLLRGQTTLSGRSSRRQSSRISSTKYPHFAKFAVYCEKHLDELGGIGFMEVWAHRSCFVNIDPL